MSDRALQDQVIRALADAPYRASPEWRRRELADPERVERYARFLARHFYYERIVHFFKYSRALARVTGRRPEAILRRPGFEALLSAIVLGSRESAQAVGRLVGEYVSESDAGIPYKRDLLRYEQTMMAVEAGPRVWRETGKEEEGRGERGLPETVEGTILLDLSHDLPEVLPKLLQPWTEVPQAPQRRARLLIARSPHGRVAVARSDEAVAAVLELADGRRTLADLARAARLEPAAMTDMLRGLIDLGAVRFSTGS